MYPGQKDSLIKKEIEREGKEQNIVMSFIHKEEV
jgi:hypothetical protein